MLKKIILLLLALCIAGGLVVGGVYLYIETAFNGDIAAADELPSSDTVLVFGALVYSTDSVSYVLANRLDTAIDIYNAGKAKKIIVSGDHGTVQYDEVNAMKNYLMERGIPQKDIFMDHAGFDTYNSIYRAHAIFEAGSTILVSQETHLKRALFISKCLGYPTKGASAIPYEGEILLQKVREIGARTKAFFQAALFKPEPKFLGEKIPVMTSDGFATQD